MNEQGTLHRRRFIISAAGVTGAFAIPVDGMQTDALAQSSPAAPLQQKSLPGYVAWKDADALIVHSTNTLETRRGAIGANPITSTDGLYVRNNLPAPSESIEKEPDSWEITIEGVNRPTTLRVGDLKRIGVNAVATVLQCSGNGRAFFKHKASGTQWGVGAAGNVVWTGVPVRALVDSLGGVAEGKKFLTGTGGEAIPKGVDPKSVIVERSVPVSAMDNALLAWGINGQPLMIAHGGPLRLVVPGYYGVNNVKYIKRLAFTENESDANIQRSGYRIRPVGQRGAPDQPSMWEMSVKSWITHPLRDEKVGRLQIYGVAFGGFDPLKKVDVSTDGGKSWREANLIGPDLGRFAWRPFVVEVDLPPGDYILASRATDAKGDVQPEEFMPNERGYGHNGWSDHAVELKVLPA